MSDKDYSESNNFWRPPKFSTPEDLENKIDEYFWVWKYQEEKPKCRHKKMHTALWQEFEIPAPTTTDLALFLWFASRQSLYDYIKNQEYSYIIKRALLFIEREYEERLTWASPTWSIFALKNMGWKDTQEIDNKISWKLETTNAVDKLNNLLNK